MTTSKTIKALLKAREFIAAPGIFDLVSCGRPPSAGRSIVGPWQGRGEYPETVCLCS
jgi:hypothetical protein